MAISPRTSTKAQDAWIETHFGVSVRGLSGVSAAASSKSGFERSSTGGNAATEASDSSLVLKTHATPLDDMPPSDAEKVRAATRRQLARALEGAGLELRPEDFEGIQSEDEVEELLRGAARRRAPGLYIEADLGNWRDLAKILYCILCWKRFPERPTITPPPPPTISGPR